MKIEFHGSAAEVIDEMRTLLTLAAPAFAITQTVDQAATSVEIPASASDEPRIEVPAPGPRTSRRGRPPKSSAPAADATTLNPPVAEPSPSETNSPAPAVADSAAASPEPMQTSDVDAAAPSLSLGDVRDALLAVQQKLGPVDTAKLIGQFGYERVKDIKPEDYAKVHAAAKKAVA